MKRIIICSVLFLCAMAISRHSYFMVEQLSDEMNLRIDALAEVLHDDNTDEALEQIASLVLFWNAGEQRLVHFVRHSHIDVISVSVARLPALAEYGEYSEVLAELATIRRQIQHIQDAEQLTFDNLL